MKKQNLILIILISIAILLGVLAFQSFQSKPPQITLIEAESRYVTLSKKTHVELAPYEGMVIGNAEEVILYPNLRCIDEHDRIISGKIFIHEPFPANLTLAIYLDRTLVTIDTPHYSNWYEEYLVRIPSQSMLDCLNNTEIYIKNSNNESVEFDCTADIYHSWHAKFIEDEFWGEYDRNFHKLKVLDQLLEYRGCGYDLEKFEQRMRELGQSK